MSKVFVNIGLSLDGYMAPEGMTMDNPGYKNWGAKWGAMMSWLVKTQYFRENLKFGPGGETGPVNDLVQSTAERIGANIMGKRMFDQGEVSLGVVDELEIALAPVLFGGGRRLFENLRDPGPRFRIDKVLDGAAATHLRYVRE